MDHRQKALMVSEQAPRLRASSSNEGEESGKSKSPRIMSDQHRGWWDSAQRQKTPSSSPATRRSPTAIKSAKITTTDNSTEASQENKKKKFPITQHEIKFQQQYYKKSDLISHYRRIKVFTACSKELDEIRSKKVDEMSNSFYNARATLRRMLAIYWRQKFSRLRRQRNAPVKEEEFKMSEE